MYVLKKPWKLRRSYMDLPDVGNPELVFNMNLSISSASGEFAYSTPTTSKVFLIMELLRLIPHSKCIK